MTVTPPLGGFCVSLTTEASKLVRQPPHEVNKGYTKQERPRNLYQEESEVNCRPHKTNEG